jgi:hypothetical protein
MTIEFGAVIVRKFVCLLSPLVRKDILDHVHARIGRQVIGTYRGSWRMR